MADVAQELYAVFGTDSESDEEEAKSAGVNTDKLAGSDVNSEREDFGWLDSGKYRECHRWQAVDGVDGLWKCEEFLDSVDQERLVTAIKDEGWFSQPAHNQAMRFGVLPGWAVTLSSLIFSSISRFVDGIDSVDKELGFRGPLPEEILHRRPLFDQMIANSYQPGEGIGPHVDLARFEDGIVVLSLLSSCVMRFRKCERFSEKVDVLLSRGDLIVLAGDARYKWTHEINRKQAEEQAWEGKLLEQKSRISVTLRRLCPEENAYLTSYISTY